MGIYVLQSILPGFYKQLDSNCLDTSVYLKGTIGTN